MPLSVSDLATRAGITPDTVRYYGRMGLLPESGRTDAGHRYYDDAALDRLRFIKGAQWLELRLGEIRSLLELFDGGTCPCGPTRELVLRRIAEIDHQRARLDEIRATLCHLLGEDPTTADHGRPSPRRTDMTDTLTAAPAAAAPETGACGCCRPASTGEDAERRELEARKVALERRLAGLLEGGR